MGSVFLLTGRPGTGKTTLIKKTLSLLILQAGGFYTEELRVAGIRKGFKIVTLDGSEAVLSHCDFKTEIRIGKYGVDLQALEGVGVASVNQAIADAELIVIDEIGKMELLSPKFREAVLKSLDSGKKMLATIMLNPNPFADDIKQRRGVKLVQVTVENREQILHNLIRELS